jgi:N-acetylglutamate synthase-like GNAT family acetyltransferase
MEPIHLRPMEPKDAKHIRRIYESIIRRPVDREFNDLIDAHARNTDDICLVAESAERVIGFMVGRIMTFSFGIEKSAWISTLGVDPDFMGREIGGRLFREIASTYKSMGIDRIYTAVQWDDNDLLSFFMSLGFASSDFINLRR